ncbi:alpha/beta hydrolase [Seonamhaeicola sp.]|uniref:alpha/beta hydrolase n=1 Tax=Seonamhaeicola sp. TaxID=1912245 RepID=UPI00261C514E|nr:alpha/beta hydrolase [Seonamhaeicola sp.]
MNKYLPNIIGALVNATALVSSEYAAKQAINMFSTPRKGKLTGEEIEYLNAATTEQIPYDGILIKTYKWEGIKETVLLAHGWESNSYRWKDLIDILRSENYTVLALDAPAHGGTTGKYFNALVYSECINLVTQKHHVNIIIGHSVGGMSTIFSHYKNPIASVEKLILIGAMADFIGVFKNYKKMMGYSEKVSKALDHYILKHYDHLPEYFSAANFSEDLATKGLIIHDKGDAIIPFSDALKFQKKYTNAKLITTEGYDHSMKSEEVYKHILNFINA